MEGKRAGAACRIQRHLWEPSALVFPSPWLQVFQLQGRQLATPASGELLGGSPIPLPSFDFLGCPLCPGTG